MSKTPTVKWAQRATKILLTVELTDVKDEKINATDDGKLTFSGKNSDGEYAFELDLAGPIVVADSKWNVGARKIVFDLAKKEDGFWDKLTKDKTPRFVKGDWDMWKDEDDSDEEAAGGANPFGGMDMASMMANMGGGGGAGGMPGMGGMDMASMMANMGGGAGGMPGMGGDSDDESGDEDDMPDLEDADDKDE